MGDAELPVWLKSLPLAPEYRPTETEFADPIAFISRVEEEAAAFGICKVVPPVPKPSKKFVFHNLNRSLSKAPELGTAADAGNRRSTPENAVFTTRHQEVGSRRARQAIHKQVWQSGELYTLEQFEAKSRAFARAHLGGVKSVSPLVVETMFWNAMGEKPMYIEYANDVPGSGFGVPKESFYCRPRQQRRRGRFKRAGGGVVERLGGVPLEVSGMRDWKLDGGSGSGKDWEGSAGWKLSNSPWNLQVIARSPGSLTRFMPDEVPGVTSPMVYIGMLFSWFAWHVEDHELHSLNFLHTGSPKTWYCVPGSYASRFEEVVRIQGYGGHVDRLAAFTLLGEKTTLLSPEVIVQSGIPCCRLVQNPGEFVVTFPRAYHVGFSHGFNCGEAANFATPKWLKVAKEAAVRRAAMNYLPMLSHQQLLYMLTLSFISRVPRDLLPGVRSSRLRDRKKEEREALVKKAFLDDLTNEHHLVHLLLGKDPAFYAVLWHPDLLPFPSNSFEMFPSSSSHEESVLSVGECKNHMIQCNIKSDASIDTKREGYIEKDMLHDGAENTTDIPYGNICSAGTQKDGLYNDESINVLDMGMIQSSYVNDGDLPCGLDVDSGTVACVACGTLGYPFMSIVQPCGKASELFSAEREDTDEKLGNLNSTKLSVSSCLVDIVTESADSVDFAVSYSLPVTKIGDSGQDHIMTPVEHERHEVSKADKNGPRRNNAHIDASECELYDKLMKDENSMNVVVIQTNKNYSESPSNNSENCCHETGVDNVDLKSKWNTSSRFLRPRIFCLQHALETWELLQCKGGAHVRIICHSDYLKIKAHAVSVAEDIDAQLDCDDVPLKNASQADLDLIFISIDDEEREEDGEDWTAKMGLNLRYCVKLRKQSSSNQEQLKLGLGGIFSNHGSLPVISGLKWHCRKSRTHHRITVPGQTRSWGTVNIKDKMDCSRSLSEPSAGIQVERTFNSEVRYKKRRGRPRKNLSGDQVSTIGASDDRTCVLVPSSSKCLTDADEVPDDGLAKSAGSSFLSVLLPEDTPIQQEHLILERIEVKSTSAIEDSVKTEDSARCSIPAGEVANSVDGISNPIIPAESLQMNENSPCNEESNVNFDVGHFVEPDCQPSIGSQTVRRLDRQQCSGQETQTEGEMTMANDTDSAQLQDILITTNVKDVCNVNVLDDQPTRSIALVKSSEMQEEITEHPTVWNSVECFMKQEKCSGADTDTRMVGANAADLISSVGLLSSEVSEIHQKRAAGREENLSRSFDLLENVKEGRLQNTVPLKLYERRRKKRQGEGDQIKNGSNPILRNKRKREVDQITDVQLSCNGFIRSPCEGLRPRTGRATCDEALSSTLKKASQMRRHKRGLDGSVGHRNQDKSNGPYQCDLQGCRMRFQTGSELSLHKRNRCTYEGCGKRFISHKYAMRHQCVHADERPLKCPWKGCNVTFKWAWARTEHVRVHTGERPYKCEAPGCGLTFRFVSDFSRHRRKTGHSPS